MLIFSAGIWGFSMSEQFRSLESESSDFVEPSAGLKRPGRKVFPRESRYLYGIDGGPKLP